MKAIVPFKIVNAKSRLSPLLTPEERKELALLMLHDITSALTAAGLEVELLTTRPFVWDGAKAVVSEKELNPALNDYLAAQDGPIMIVMADVPLITEKNVRDIIGSQAADLVICPGRGGGTNLQLIRRPDKYHVDYYGASFLDHVRIAEESGLSVEVYDSFNISSDIDEAGDLVELYIHGSGEAAKYLRSLMVLDSSKGRVRVVREETNIHAVRIPGKMTG
ncbi:MAG TPA: 2-phospho-L-lactate guanylyltransferase [Methanocella sp.]|nr:2-phospho-L-lactate guanylyltransferase [Methanocella sp.]